VAAMLAPRDARQLAATLQPFLGERGANLIFGIGVFAMAWSTMIVHMLMNGLAISALVRRFDSRRIFMLGACMPAITGMLAPILWTGPSRAALAIPASVIATTLLPIAYFGFLLLMNSRAALGDARPSGARRLWWNVLMVLSTGAASYASIWALLNKPGWWGQAGLAVLALLAVLGVVGFVRNTRPR
jgi:Mn2+/Fe2+ NRAMP family transporter